jgi:DNA-binding CsgD family transcriptional regulator
MDEPTLTPRALLHAVIAEVARECGVDAVLIKARCNIRKIVHARALVAKRLLGRGLSEQRVADMMHVNLKTVQVYLGRRARYDSKVTHHNREDARS